VSRSLQVVLELLEFSLHLLAQLQELLNVCHAFRRNDQLVMKTGN
jgi:hypothetical protein